MGGMMPRSGFGKLGDFTVIGPSRQMVNRGRLEFVHSHEYDAQIDRRPVPAQPRADWRGRTKVGERMGL
jgi:hypothetical protein